MSGTDPLAPRVELIAGNFFQGLVTVTNAQRFPVNALPFAQPLPPFLKPYPIITCL